MSPEEALIRAVETNPAADLPRLVYTDWLDENRREPFADFLRSELELAKLPLDSPAAPPLRERLWQTWAAVDAVWLHRFTQPKMLRANPTPFPAGWLHFDLLHLRRHAHRADGWAYDWDYDTLPSLPADEFLSTFAYLGEPVTPPDQPGSYFPSFRPVGGAEGYRIQVERVREVAEGLGVRLPGDFLALMGNIPLRESFYSAEENYFETFAHSNRTLPKIGDNGTAVLCYVTMDPGLDWSLLVHRSGAHCVVAQYEARAYPNARQRAWFVAPSFAAFVYRIWVECRIWWDYLHAETGGAQVQPITPAIEAYIDHYRRDEPGA